MPDLQAFAQHMHERTRQRDLFVVDAHRERRFAPPFKKSSRLLCQADILFTGTLSSSR